MSKTTNPHPKYPLSLVLQLMLCPKHTYHPTERKTVVYLETPCRLRAYQGTAECHPDDTPNPKVGEALALNRAVNQLLNFEYVLQLVDLNPTQQLL